MKKKADAATDEDWKERATAYGDNMHSLLEIEKNACPRELNRKLELYNFLELEELKLAINSLDVIRVQNAFFQRLILCLRRAFSNPSPSPILTPMPNPGPRPLPQTELCPGDPIAIYATEAGWAETAPFAKGILCEITPTHLFVEIADGTTMPTTGLTIVKTVMTGQYSICDDAVAKFTKPIGAIPYLSKVILEQAQPCVLPSLPRAEKLNPSAKATLDSAQQDAVLRAFAAQDLALIEGPPGTGKTRVLAECIPQVRLFLFINIGSLLGQKEVPGLRVFR
jgi:hypothetical protein